MADVDPALASRSSTLRSDSGYLTYIITTSRITSGELLKYRNGLLMTLSYHGQRRPPKIALTMPYILPHSAVSSGSSSPAA